MAPEQIIRVIVPHVESEQQRIGAKREGIRIIIERAVRSGCFVWDLGSEIKVLAVVGGAEAIHCGIFRPAGGEQGLGLRGVEGNLECVASAFGNDGDRPDFFPIRQVSVDFRSQTLEGCDL